VEHHRSTARGFDEEGHVERPFALDVLLLRPAQEVSSKLDCSLRNGEYRVYYTVTSERRRTKIGRNPSFVLLGSSLTSTAAAKKPTLLDEHMKQKDATRARSENQATFIVLNKKK
jgi:hypothetical protein